LEKGFNLPKILYNFSSPFRKGGDPSEKEGGILYIIRKKMARGGGGGLRSPEQGKKTEKKTVF